MCLFMATIFILTNDPVGIGIGILFVLLTIFVLRELLKDYYFVVYNGHLKVFKSFKSFKEFCNDHLIEIEKGDIEILG